MSVISTSTAATATAYSNQRKIDRTSNGVLWMLHLTGGTNKYSLDSFYSVDEGATWSYGGNIRAGGSSYEANASLFIDADDYAHVAYKDTADGFIYYRRGTPNAARTAWTWSAALLVDNAYTSIDYPDIVAHPEGSGWKAHVVYGNNSSGADWVSFFSITITSAGAITLGSRVALAAYAGNTVHKYPSIDFYHIGDGKTVKDGTPHLYVAWSAGATGAGKGIRFKKATYSAGTWTWGTEREIDPNVYVNGNYWLNCLFDGTQVIIGALPSGDVDPDLKLYERDAADTNTVVRTLLSNVITGTPANALLSGSMTYDGDGNVYFFGADYTGTTTTRKINWRMWDRASQAIGPLNTIETSGMNSPYMSAKRGHSGRRIEFIYTDGSASPYSVTYGGISLNELPSKPTGLEAKWESGAINIDYIHNDPDGDPQSKRQFRYRKAVV